MSRKKLQEKLSMDHALQDFKVSSLSDDIDFGNTLSLPSDSSLMQELVGYEVPVKDMSLNKSLPSGSCPADSTFMENVVKKSERLIFKKPFDLKHKLKPRSSIFDSDLKDSEPNTPEQTACLPFYRKKDYFTKNSLSENNFNLSNENFDSSNNSLNICQQNDELKNCKENVTISESDSFISKGLPLQRKREGRSKKKSSISINIFEQCLDDSINSTLHDSSSSQNNKKIMQEKLHTTLDKQEKKLKSLDKNDTSFSKQINFITMRKKRQTQLQNSRIFDNDINTSESDESFYSRPALQRIAINKEMKNSNLFDDALELSANYSISKLKSPSPGRLLFNTCKTNQRNEFAGFDSLLNESSKISDDDKSNNDSEDRKQLSCESLHSSFVGELARCLSIVDSEKNDTCDTSNFQDNGSVLKDNSYGQEEESLNPNRSPENKNSSNTNISLKTKSRITPKALGVPVNTEDFTDKLHSLSETSISKVVHTSITKNKAEIKAKSPVECTTELAVESTVMQDSNNSTLTADKGLDNELELSVCETRCNPQSINSQNPNIFDEKADSSSYCNTALNSSENYLVEKCCANSSFSSEDKQMVINATGQVQHVINHSNEDEQQVSDTLSDNVSNYNAKNPAQSYELNPCSPNKTFSLESSKATLSIYEKEKDGKIIEEEPSLVNDSMNDSISKDNSLNDIPVKFNTNDINFKINSTEVSLASTVNNKQTKEGKSKSSLNISQIRNKSMKRVSFQFENRSEERKQDKSSVFTTMFEEERSTKRSQSLRLSSSSSLDAFHVCDDPSPRITSNSEFLDLNASRDKTLSNSLGIESMNYGVVDGISKSSLTLQSNLEEGEESNEDENLGSMSDQEVNDEEEFSEENEIKTSVMEDQQYTIGSTQNIDSDNECNSDEEVEDGQISSEHNKERPRQDDYIGMSNENSLLQTVGDKSGNTSKSMQYEDELMYENENSFIRSKNNNFPLFVRQKFQFKKPGRYTVLNESLSTPLSKRKIKEMLDKIPLSEFKKKKSKRISDAPTEEQIEQDMIEEVLRKRQKQKTGIPLKQTNKLKKPNKYMYHKIYDFIIEKLTPIFDLKSHIKAEEVVMFLNEQVNKIMKKKEDQQAEIVQEMKLKLAQLGIICTHWDFHQFIMKYFDRVFTDQIYPLDGNFVDLSEPTDLLQNVL